MNRREVAFLALVGAAPAALALAASILLLGAMAGRHPMWQPTEADLVSAIRNQNPVATRVYGEALPSIDAPVPFSHPRILDARELALPPLAVALVAGHAYMVETLREGGSDPAQAIGRLSPEVAAALLGYATETQNALAIEYLTKYRADPPRAIRR
jgi:hypothetical protein